jgi:3-oxoacyl-[acyl-carrier protein] reductase
MMLDGKVCLITGSTRGIGWATAELFAKSGAIVVLNSRGGDLLEQRKRALEEQSGRPVLALTADAGDPKAVQTCYAEIFKQHKKLDVLVNNAGIMRDAPLGMITAELLQAVTQTNVMGPILHLQAAARLMSRTKAGSIVNLTSIIGREGKEGQTVYASSKAALMGMTRAAAKELAPMGIRVNAVAPGMIETDMTRGLAEEHHRAALGSIKMGRIGQPSEVANAILFLASDMSSYITGQVLGVDGGMII